MNDQPTTTEEAAASRPATADELREDAARPAPEGTRELRDAQAAREQPVADRPRIRAEGEGQAPPAAGSAPAGSAPAGSAGAGSAASPDAPLFDEAAGGKLRERWLVIQTEFVDAPRGAVEKADALVAEVLKQLTESFANEREQLEAGWSRAGDGSAEGSNGSGGGSGTGASTEELRQAIQRYRSFFNRLLTL